jgi:heparan-alpha-glucosaminide N-acetyltransferase
MGAPRWALFSGGLCFLWLAAFSWVIAVKRHRKWAFPLVVIGMNPIAAYCIAHLVENFITTSFRIHLGPNFSELIEGTTVLLCFWLVLF